MKAATRPGGSERESGPGAAGAAREARPAPAARARGDRPLILAAVEQVERNWALSAALILAAVLAASAF